MLKINPALARRGQDYADDNDPEESLRRAEEERDKWKRRAATLEGKKKELEADVKILEEQAAEVEGLKVDNKRLKADSGEKAQLIDYLTRKGQDNLDAVVGLRRELFKMRRKIHELGDGEDSDANVPNREDAALEEIHRLQQEVSEQRNIKAAYFDGLVELDKKEKRLEGEKAVLQGEVDQANQKLEDVRRRMQQLQEEVAVALEEAEQARKKDQEEIEQLGRKVRKQKAKRAEERKRAEDLKKAMEVMKEWKKEDLSGEGGGASTSKLESRIQELEGRLEAKTRVLGQLRQRVKELEQKLAGEGEMVSGLRADNRALEAKVAEKEALQEDLREKWGDVQKIHAWTRKILSPRLKLAPTGSTSSAGQSQEQDLPWEDLVEAIRARISQLEQTVSRRQEEKAEADRDGRIRQEKLEEAEGEVRDARARISLAHQKNQSLQAKLDGTEISLQDSKRQVQGLKNDLKKKSEELKAAEARNRKKSEELKRARKETEKEASEKRNVEAAAKAQKAEFEKKTQENLRNSERVEGKYKTMREFYLKIAGAVDDKEAKAAATEATLAAKEATEATPNQGKKRKKQLTSTSSAAGTAGDVPTEPSCKKMKK